MNIAVTSIGFFVLLAINNYQDYIYHDNIILVSYFIIGCSFHIGILPIYYVYCSETMCGKGFSICAIIFFTSAIVCNSAHIYNKITFYSV